MLSFISLTPGGRSFMYQGWSWISWIVMRLAGSAGAHNEWERGGVGWGEGRHSTAPGQLHSTCRSLLSAVHRLLGSQGGVGMRKKLASKGCSGAHLPPGCVT